MQPVVLSHVQAERLLQAYRAGRPALEVSPDLGLSSVEAVLAPDGVRFPHGQSLGWEAIKMIARSERGCFAIAGATPQKIQVFSEHTNRLYSLMPTQGAPTMLVSGIPMHRFKASDPHRDTLQKIASIAPLTGHVLDTATGLGYTAIQTARTAQHVTTIELDPAALEVAGLNPWSRELFENPRITQLVGDSFDEIQQFADGAFSHIIHDPPTFSLAGDLYSGAFYGHLFRVLQPGGRLFHYIGDLDSRSGRSVAKGAVRRLQEAGFSRVTRRPQAFGLTARK